MEKVVVADLSNETHAEALLALLDAYSRDIMGGGQVLSEFTRANLINELRKRPGCHVVLAFIEGKAAGLAICFEGFSTFNCKPILNLHDFAVAPEFRRRGLAKRLLKKVEELACDIGCGKLTLEVLEGNEPARRLYADCGFASYELNPEMGRALFFEKPLG